MRTPSSREADGFDVVVWVDKDGDIVAKAFSTEGDKALKQYVNDYRKGDIIEIYVPPSQFEADMPQTLRVGLLTTARGVVTMRTTALH